MSEHDANKRSAESLAERLRESIRLKGSITFRDWMAAALYDEAEGYYCRSDQTRWGRAGDYRTSPERSPLFAATFAGYFAKLYEELGSPTKWTILEAGAGSGHFAEGVLEALQRIHPRVFSATRYLIDDVSPAARALTRERLEAFRAQVEFVSLNEITDPFEVGIIFSNELLDAMPVHRVIMRSGELLELCVGLDETKKFVWLEKEAPQLLKKHFDEFAVRLDENQIAEVNVAAGDWLCHAAASLARGYIVTVDYGAESADLYGAEHRHNGTLRAFRRHRFAGDVLAYPGEQDITTTLDWTYLKQRAAECGLVTVALERQDRFLLQEGLLVQLERMTSEAQSEADALILRTSAREMILPTGQSASFQVLVQKRESPSVPRTARI